VLQPGDNQEFLQQIRHYLINELNLHVASTCIHPLGVGLIELESARHRDGLMLGKLHEVDGIRVRFIRHDYGLNRRSKPYTRFGWIMILGFPLDYRALNFIDQAVAPFGKLISWHNNPRAKGYVLVKCCTTTSTWFQGACSSDKGIEMAQAGAGVCQFMF
jgi:hypothetical protein